MADRAFFDELIGHEQLKKRWIHLIEEGRVPHASIFSGPAGTGKTVAAVALASALVGRKVLQHIDFSAPDSMIHDGEDVFYIGPEKSMLKTAQFRDLQEIISLRGSAQDIRVFIIDHVETMNAEFANRMLKTLEEPAEGIVFILITDKPAALLPTVVSRCVMFRFDSVGTDELTAALKTRYKGDEGLCEEAAFYSGGNVKAALDYLHARSSLAPERAFYFLKTVKESPVPFAEWSAYTVSFHESESVEVMQFILRILRDLLLLRVGVSIEKIQLKRYASELSAIVLQWPEDEIQQGIKAVEEGLEGVPRYVNIHLIWDYICLTFLQGRGLY